MNSSADDVHLKSLSKLTSHHRLQINSNFEIEFLRKQQSTLKIH